MIRPVEPRDCEAITAIYNHYVAATTATFDTDPVDPATMAHRIADIAAHYPYFVAVDRADGSVTGFCYAHPWKTKAAYASTLETTIYLHPDRCGQGTGSLLMDRLEEACRASGTHTLIACITAENAGSRAFHQRRGYRQVSLFEEVGRKFGRWLSVADYVLRLS